MKIRLEVSESEGKLLLLLPKNVATAMDLRHGDQIDVELYSRFIEHDSSICRQHLAKLRRYRGRMPANFKFDRHDANSR